MDIKKIILTRQELVELWNNFSLLNDIRSFKLGYAIIRTKIKIKTEELDALEELSKPDAEFNKYEEQRQLLCLKYSKKDDQGSAIIKGGQFVFGDNWMEFSKEIKPLNDLYAGTIANREKQISEYNKFLKETVNVEIYQISEEDVPGTPKYNEKYPESKYVEPTVAQMGIIYYFLKD